MTYVTETLCSVELHSVPCGYDFGTLDLDARGNNDHCPNEISGSI
jgi:hypothetical protein